MDNLSQSINTDLLKYMEQLKVHGLSALIVKNNHILWHTALGSAQENTIFRVASISKTVITTALMQLFEKGLFKLEDDISDYLDLKIRNPKYPHIPINFIHLFTHTSGLTEVGDDYFYDNIHDPKLKYLSQLVCTDGDFYRDEIWANYAPGDFYDYSNIGYTILGCLIEKISGMAFNDYCIEHIFKPLGMEDSSFDVTKLKHLENLTPIYRFDESMNSHCISFDDYSINSPTAFDYSDMHTLGNCIKFSPAGGLRTSLLDLSKFMRTHMNMGEHEGVRILSPETAELMQDIHWEGKTVLGKDKKIGLCFYPNENLYPNCSFTGHSGDAYGILSGMFFNKDLDLGIIFVENGGIQYKEEGHSLFKIEELCYERILREFLA